MTQTQTRSPQQPRPAPAPASTLLGRLSAQNTGLVLAWLLGVAMLVLYLALFAARKSALPGNFELTSTVNNTVPLIFAALGQSFAVLTSGLDLSVGGVMDVSNSLAASQMGTSPGGILLWTVLILLFGAATGLVNGLLVAYGRLQPILVTLGTLAILQGLALKVLPQPGGTTPPALTKALADPDAPYGLILVALACLIWFVARRTSFGMWIYAVGNDRVAARARGVPVRRTLVLAYVTSGTFASAAGIMLAATTTGGDAASGDVFTLTSIAAVVIGGVSLFGGRGSAIGAILGAFVLTLLINVLFFASVDPLYEPFYEGLFLVLAAAATTLAGYWLRRGQTGRRFR